MHSSGLPAPPIDSHSRPPFHVPSFHHISLFEIRLDGDSVVFWGSENASTSQMLRGVLVLCLQSPLKIEDVHLQLVGTLRYSWADPGLLGHKINIVDYRWPPFIGRHGKTMTLPAGNYEWPFEYLLPGDTAESIEGIPEASILYKLKATIGRGKLAMDLHAYKRFRIIRTLSVDSLEMMPSITVGNTWLDKVDYSISIPTKAATFGGFVSLTMHLTPLLKGLDLGEILVTLMETREFSVHIPNHPHLKEHRAEREVSQWRLQVTRECWQEMIEDTGQEGWSMTKRLDIPKKLQQCSQDVNHHAIKVDHKLKVRIRLKNPDGHISELLVVLPIYLFISPNMPLDDQGNLLTQTGINSDLETETTASPPGYGAHVLDQLYEDINACQSPEVLPQQMFPVCTQPVLDQTHNNMVADINNQEPVSIVPSPSQQPATFDLDSSEFYELNRVPTYRTAVRSPLRSHSPMNNATLPDYRTAAAIVPERLEGVHSSIDEESGV